MAGRRRGRAEGSIYRRKDGRWVGQYGVNGKRRYVYGKTRKDVAGNLTKAIAERDAGLVFDAQNLSLADYLDLWLDSVSGTLAPNTVRRHEELARLHIRPVLGRVKLSKLDPLRVQAFYRSKLAEGLSAATVVKIHSTLSKSLKQAVRWGLIPLNVCASVTPPRVPRTEEQRPIGPKYNGRDRRQREDPHMPRYVALLRAINVGGRRVKMDHLRELFGALGFTNVETFIASGNVIFDSETEDTQTLERKIQDHLRGSLGYEVATFVRTVSELGNISRYRPFDSSDSDAEGTSLYIAFLLTLPSAEAQEKLMAFRNEVDDFRVHGREVYWLCRKKISESAFSGALLEKVLGMPATMRNATTIEKLVAKYPASR